MKDAIRKPPFFIRMEKEMVELTGKVDRCEKFINENESFLKLSENRQDLLKRQLVTMKDYQLVLQERLDLESSELETVSEE